MSSHNPSSRSSLYIPQTNRSCFDLYIYCHIHSHSLIAVEQCRRHPTPSKVTLAPLLTAADHQDCGSMALLACPADLKQHIYNPSKHMLATRLRLTCRQHYI